MDAIRNAVTRSIAVGECQSVRGNVRRENIRVRQFPSERNGKTARTRANVGDAQPRAGLACVEANLDAARAETIERHFNHMLGLRSRNERGGRHFKFESPKFLLAREI